MRECFLVTAYCNTIEKKTILKQCISELKRYNIDIMIHAHYPLDSDIQNSVKYYIYNSTNPVISDGTKSIINWRYMTEVNKRFTLLTHDVGYAVMLQWEQGLSFLNKLNYEKIYIINFDVFIKDYIFYNSKKYLDNNDIAFCFLDYNCSDNFSQYQQLNTMFFCIKNTIISEFLMEITYNKYINSIDTCLETFLVSDVIKTLEYNYKIKKIQPDEFGYSSKDNTSDIIDRVTNTDYFKQYDIGEDDFFYFIGKNIKSGFIEIIFLFIKDNIKKIEIKINDKKYSHIIEKSNKLIISTLIPNDKLNVLILNKNIKITINDKSFNDDMNRYINATIE